MVAMITYDGTCCIGLNVDPTVFPDTAQIERCMNDGFAEVLAIGDRPSSTPEAPR
jgi:hypothetical protein